MNENQQPLQDEKENQAAEAAAAAAPAEAAETGEPEQPESPAEDRVFGTMCVTVCAAAGYLISRMVYKKRETDASQNSK